MTLEEAIVAYFRALHWQSPEWNKKNDGGARHCKHFVAIILDGKFPIEYK
jgi:hypothetical protein